MFSNSNIDFGAHLYHLSTIAKIDGSTLNIVFIKAFSMHLEKEGFLSDVIVTSTHVMIKHLSKDTYLKVGFVLMDINGNYVGDAT